MPSEEKSRDLAMARAVAAAAAEAGGRCYYVGGYVRDRLLGRETKDVDIEVHRLPLSTLEAILDSLGERIQMGASFGVLGLRHCSLDIAMPRREEDTGRGHRDFAVYVDPFLGEEKAARRRDFTMNAMMEDVLSGELLDFFGGREDLRRGIVRHVDDRSYGEDPLRAFRAAQFAARFGFTVAEETRRLSGTMAVDALPGERVMGELEKALLGAARPSLFFEELRAMGQLSCWFPELEALAGVEQNPDFHPEGDVWTHSMQVLDQAARLREQAAEPLYFMLSALCHDLGKAAATTRIHGVLHAYGHETAGLPLVRALLGRLTRERKLTDYVLNMTELHMRPNSMLSQGAKPKAFMGLFDRSCCAEDLLLLSRADYLGRQGPDTDPQALEASYAEMERRLRELLSEYRQRMGREHLMGRDLLDAGLSPGPEFRQALDYAHKLRLAGLPKDQQLRQTLGYVRALEREKP